VLLAAGYDVPGLTEGFGRQVSAAEGQSKVASDESAALREAYDSTLESYTYLED
jgi:hypothetical protein